MDTKVLMVFMSMWIMNDFYFILCFVLFYIFPEITPTLCNWKKYVLETTVGWYKNFFCCCFCEDTGEKSNVTLQWKYVIC